MNNSNNNFFEKLISVRRVTTVAKGGRRFGFSALVVVGDHKGLIAVGLGKAGEITEARVKASKLARKNLIRVPIKSSRTLHHDVEARFNSAHIIIRAAESGTGIIAGGAARSLLEALGLQDVVAKSLGSSDPMNLAMATLKALSQVRTPKILAMRRGKKITEIVSKRNLALKISESNND